MAGSLYHFDGPLVVGYPSTTSGGGSLIARERLGAIPGGAGSSPAILESLRRHRSLSIGFSQFRRAVEFGLSVKAGNRQRVQITHHRATGVFPSRSLSVAFFGWVAAPRLSHCVAQLRESVSCKREDAGSTPDQKHRSRLLSILHLKPFRRVDEIGLSLITTWPRVRLTPPEMTPE